MNKSNKAKMDRKQFESWYTAQFKPRRHRKMSVIQAELAAAFKHLARIEAEYREANEELERRKIATYVREAAMKGFKF